MRHEISDERPDLHSRCPCSTARLAKAALNLLHTTFAFSHVALLTICPSRKEDITRIFAGLLLFISLLILGCQTEPIAPTATQSTQTIASPAIGSLSKGGFDQFGYNYGARLFQGPADGVDRILDGMVWGDPTFAKDHLVMKWSKGWDDARFNGVPWGPDAWEDNEWNGNVPGRSGFTEHVKIIWVGSDLQNSQYWRDRGYPIWGEFEVIMDQGMDPNFGHTWYAHAISTGYGMTK